jgi:hypothetical protein
VRNLDAGGLMKRLTGFQDRFGAAHDLEANPAREHTAEHRARMPVATRRLARGQLDPRHPHMVDNRQRVEAVLEQLMTDRWRGLADPGDATWALLSVCSGALSALKLLRPGVLVATPGLTVQLEAGS